MGILAHPMESPMNIPSIELTAQRGRIRLRMVCLHLGKDLCVTLSGGDREHIGAVALSHPGSEVTSAIALLGHREEDLAKDIASRISARMDVAACVVCGIHVDGLRPEELKDILEMSLELTEELSERLVY